MPSGGVIEVAKYPAYLPEAGFTGDIEQVALYAGESCGLINEIKPAATIVHDLVREAEDVLAQLLASSGA